MGFLMLVRWHLHIEWGTMRWFNWLPCQCNRRCYNGLTQGMSPWWSLLELLSWCHTLKSSYRGSLEDRAHVEFLYGCPIFRWVEVTCLHGRVARMIALVLQWRHNGRGSVSNHQLHDYLLNRLFRRRSKKTSKLHVTGLCAGNSPGPVNSPHKWPVTRKMFPFDDVIMKWTPGDMLR